MAVQQDEKKPGPVGARLNDNDVAYSFPLSNRHGSGACDGIDCTVVILRADRAIRSFRSGPDISLGWQKTARLGRRQRICLCAWNGQWGRDMLSTILYGGRISLLVGFAAVFLGMFLGVMLGVISGYVGGWFETLIMRLADIQLTIPGILTAILINGILRSVLPPELHEVVGDLCRHPRYRSR